MALFTSNISQSSLCAADRHHLPRRSSLSHRRTHLSLHTSSFVARARRGLSSRTRRLEDRGKKGAVVAPEVDEEKEKEEDVKEEIVEDLTGMPVLPGEEPDFWEGPQWNALGFFVQYLWAFGLVFAVIACGIAVATYNEGATDFKQTPAYKESIQSQELLEESESANTDVFESNPTEEAPSLE